jgi:hypothetical protein
MSGTGQKNNPNASARSSALGIVDSGAVTANTGPILRKTVEATNSAMNIAINSNGVGDYVGGEWQHVVWERVGSTTYLVVNGVEVANGSDTLENEAFGFLPPVTSGYTDNNGSNSFSLGSTYIPSGHRAFQGNMAQICRRDRLRLLEGLPDQLRHRRPERDRGRVQQRQRRLARGLRAWRHAGPVCAGRER